MKKTLTLMATLAALLLGACDGSVYYAEYQDVDEQGWLPADSARFDVPVDDTNLVLNFLVEVRNTVAYPYANTFLFINTSFPDGTMACDTMECPLADPAGQWLGKRSGRYVDTRYFLRRNVRFPMPGNYHFAMTNGMRDSAIAGLAHVGLRIEYAE